MCNRISLPHMNHVVVVKISETWGLSQNSTKWFIECPLCSFKPINPPKKKSNPHTDFTASHSHKACMTSSARQPQRWHVGSESIFLLSKFIFVGKLLVHVHAFHRKCLTLPGKPSYFWCNIDDQKTKEKVIAFSLNNIVTTYKPISLA